MIQEFVDKFIEKRPALEAAFLANRPSSYKSIVKSVIEIVTDEDVDYGEGPDPERIHEIDDGDYQGTLLFIIAAKGYQPHNYWYVKVGYGSCSGCDTFQAIYDYSEDEMTPQQAKEYATLALHIVQGLKKME